MADEVKVGDIVQLKSGGPKMTVDNIGQYDYGTTTKAACSWFDGTKKFESLFPLTSIKKADS